MYKRTSFWGLERMHTLFRYLFPTIALVISFIYGLDHALESGTLERSYIFSPKQLHTLSISAISSYGNDTRALVANIVDQLQDKPDIAPYLTSDEEWVFNNAGGAMGAMRILHASQSPNSARLDMI